MSKYKRYYVAATPVFITIVPQYRKPWLIKHADIVLASMRRVKENIAFVTSLTLSYLMMCALLLNRYPIITFQK